MYPDAHCGMAMLGVNSALQSAKTCGPATVRLLWAWADSAAFCLLCHFRAVCVRTAAVMDFEAIDEYSDAVQALRTAVDREDHRALAGLLAAHAPGTPRPFGSRLLADVRLRAMNVWHDSSGSRFEPMTWGQPNYTPQMQASLDALARAVYEAQQAGL